jgi:branched-subunit amino acid ABC-type transport system permease component
MKSMHCMTLLSGLVLVALSGVAWAGIGPPPPSVGPEPTSLALLAAGLGGLAWVKFRRRK